MTLERLGVQRFRNIHQVSVDLQPGLNLIHGDNGSGKTSLLESIYFLSTGRSFRSGALQPVIQKGSEECLVTGNYQQGGGRYQLGSSRSVDGSTPRPRADRARGPTGAARRGRRDRARRHRP